MNLGRRLLRGLLLAVVFSFLGWIASRLTVDMVLKRHFDAGQQQTIERVLTVLWIVAGLLTGASLDRRVLSSAYIRPVCWGAVLGLMAVMLCVRIPLSISPKMQFQTITILGMPTRFDLETMGLLSAPGGLIAGGVLGAVYHWNVTRKSERNREEKSAD